MATAKVVLANNYQSTVSSGHVKPTLSFENLPFRTVVSLYKELQVGVLESEGVIVDNGSPDVNVVLLDNVTSLSSFSNI